MSDSAELARLIDGLAADVDWVSAVYAARTFGVGAVRRVFDPDAPLTEDRGWVLSEVLDGKAGKSFLAVFEAGHIEDGPVAKLKLSEHLPMSFHGWWEAA